MELINPMRVNEYTDWISIGMALKNYYGDISEAF